MRQSSVLSLLLVGVFAAMFGCSSGSNSSDDDDDNNNNDNNDDNDNDDNDDNDDDTTDQSGNSQSAGGSSGSGIFGGGSGNTIASGNTSSYASGGSTSSNVFGGSSSVSTGNTGNEGFVLGVSERFGGSQELATGSGGGPGEVVPVGEPVLPVEYSFDTSTEGFAATIESIAQLTVQPANGVLEVRGILSATPNQKIGVALQDVDGFNWIGAESLTAVVQVVNAQVGTLSLFIESGTGASGTWVRTTGPAIDMSTADTGWVTLEWDLTEVTEAGFDWTRVRRFGLEYNSGTELSTTEVIFRLDSLAVDGDPANAPAATSGTGGAGSGNDGEDANGEAGESAGSEDEVGGAGSVEEDPEGAEGNVGGAGPSTDADGGDGAGGESTEGGSDEEGGAGGAADSDERVVASYPLNDETGWGIIDDLSDSFAEEPLVSVLADGAVQLTVAFDGEGAQELTYGVEFADPASWEGATEVAFDVWAPTTVDGELSLVVQTEDNPNGFEREVALSAVEEEWMTLRVPLEELGDLGSVRSFGIRIASEEEGVAVVQLDGFVVQAAE